jgi:hypothetical protein
MRVIIFSCQRRLRGFPSLSFLAPLAAAFGCEPVELGLAVVLGKAHSASTALALEPPQCRVERAFFDQQHFFGLAANEARDREAVQPAPDQGLENQDVQSAADEIELGFIQMAPFAFWGKFRIPPL